MPRTCRQSISQVESTALGGGSQRQKPPKTNGFRLSHHYQTSGNPKEFGEVAVWRSLAVLASSEHFVSALEKDYSGIAPIVRTHFLNSRYCEGLIWHFCLEFLHAFSNQSVMILPLSSGSNPVPQIFHTAHSPVWSFKRSALPTRLRLAFQPLWFQQPDLTNRVKMDHNFRGTSLD
jgi:hypothetical protein